MTGIRDAVHADVRRWVDGNDSSSRRVLSLIWHDMGLQAVLWYRFGQALRTARHRILLWPLLPLGWLIYACGAVLVRRGYGIRLSLSADIGPGFWVGHFGGIEVTNCRLGERCSVGQQTKVGRAGERAGPQVGDEAWIGAHARITGPVKVGNGVTVAPGARVTRNVPDRSLVVGDPGRVLRGYDNTPILPRA
jgi:serine O-acetyltransferase